MQRIACVGWNSSAPMAWRVINNNSPRFPNESLRLITMLFHVKQASQYPEILRNKNHHGPPNFLRRFHQTTPVTPSDARETACMWVKWCIQHFQLFKSYRESYRTIRPLGEAGTSQFLPTNWYVSLLSGGRVP